MDRDTTERVLRRLKIREIMVKDPITIDSEMTIEDTAKAMARSTCGCLLVMSKGKVIGIVTERDLVRKSLSNYPKSLNAKVSTIMTSPLVVVHPDVTVEEAARVMADHQVRRLPIVDDRGVVGLITVTDLAKALAKELQYSDAIFNAMARIPNPPKAVYG